MPYNDRNRNQGGSQLAKRKEPENRESYKEEKSGSEITHINQTVVALPVIGTMFAGL